MCLHLFVQAERRPNAGRTQARCNLNWKRLYRTDPASKRKQTRPNATKRKTSFDPNATRTQTERRPNAKNCQFLPLRTPEYMVKAALAAERSERKIRTRTHRTRTHRTRGPNAPNARAERTERAGANS